MEIISFPRADHIEIPVCSPNGQETISVETCTALDPVHIMFVRYREHALFSTKD